MEGNYVWQNGRKRGVCEILGISARIMQIHGRAERLLSPKRCITLPHRTDKAKERVTHVHKPFPRFTEPVVFHCTEKWKVLMKVSYMGGQWFLLLQSDGYTFSKDGLGTRNRTLAYIYTVQSSSYFYWDGIGGMTSTLLRRGHLRNLSMRRSGLLVGVQEDTE